MFLNKIMAIHKSLRFTLKRVACKMAKWEGPELISSLCKFGHTKITEQVFAEQLVFSSFLKVCSEFCFNTVSFSGFFFFFYLEACGILGPRSGLNLPSLHWEVTA